MFDYKQNKIIKAAEKLFNIQDFDIIHAYTLFTVGNCARYLSNKYSVPFVVAVRNTDVNIFFKYQLLLRKRGLSILNAAHNVLFLSAAYKDCLLKKYIPKELNDNIVLKARVIPNGIDEFWFQRVYKTRNYCEIRDRIQKRNVRLIYVGSVNRNKNVELIIKAINLLKAEGWDIRLNVVGSVLDEKVFGRIKSSPDIVYTSKQPKETLINYYRDADILVMPSHYETFGLVYAEAMSQGLPVVYTRGQGFDQQFAEGKDGFSVDSNNYNELAINIKKICENYVEISRNCLTGVERFQLDRIAKEYCEIYRKIKA